MKNLSEGFKINKNNDSAILAILVSGVQHGDGQSDRQIARLLGHLSTLSRNTKSHLLHRKNVASNEGFLSIIPVW
jgi:hypothetical protein